MYEKHFSTRKTPQSEAIPGKDMVPDSAGGYAFAVDDWKRLDRFLILGAEGGTYYIKERELTKENAEAVMRCIAADGNRVLQRVIEVSDKGLAPKNDPALFVLAMCVGLGDTDTRRSALESLPAVARIGTHLFTFIRYVEAFRGWGRLLREAVAGWYNEKTAERLAYQVVKYQQRGGWSHRDVLRLSHPKPKTDGHDSVFAWVTQGEIKDGVPEIIAAFEKAKTADEEQTIKLIAEHGLTREMIRTEHLGSPRVWGALLEKMPMTAMIRNLGNMSKIGLLAKGKWETVNKVVGRITDEAALRKSRIHPLSILAALVTYQRGKGLRGSGEWEPVGDVVDALDDAFYLAFGNVEATNKRRLIGLDVSGSMASSEIAGVGGISPRMGSAAMCLVTYRTEPNVAVMMFSQDFIPLEIGRKERLDSVMKKIYNLPFQGTDCALPMLYALKNGIEVDVFEVYTDSETWAGDIHPVQALQEYRRQSGIPAKLIVVGMVSNGFSIADPNDGGMLDVVGFDVSAPSVMRQFILETA